MSYLLLFLKMGKTQYILVAMDPTKSGSRASSSARLHVGPAPVWFPPFSRC